MKHEINNEMDRLLRRLSRREGVPASDADLRTEHLDADELSSYAENLLTATARAHYTEHLAECARCRKLVVQLSASAPVVAGKDTVTAAEASGLRGFLAGLFSPMVLRYAIPVLVLIVAASIGVVVLRSNRPDSFIAELDRPQPMPAPTLNEQPQEPASLPDTQARRDSQIAAATPESRRDSSKEVAGSGPRNAPPVPDSGKVEPKTETAVQTAEEQTAANAAPPAKPLETTNEVRVELHGRKATSQPAAVAGTGVASERQYEAARAEAKKAEEVAPGASPAKAKTTDLRAQTGATTSGLRMSEKQEKDGDDGETRSVGGRHFRNQGGVWVDTAYNAGSATMNIARGSEPYRVLVADEPGIKTIVDQLSGPVIVVWKGRAYRIR